MLEGVDNFLHVVYVKLYENLQTGMVFLIIMFKCIAVIFGKPSTQVIMTAIFKCVGFIFCKHCTQFSAQKPVSSGLS